MACVQRSHHDASSLPYRVRYHYCHVGSTRSGSQHTHAIAYPSVPSVVLLLLIGHLVANLFWTCACAVATNSPQQHALAVAAPSSVLHLTHPPSALLRTALPAGRYTGLPVLALLTPCTYALCQRASPTPYHRLDLPLHLPDSLPTRVYRLDNGL